MENLDSKPNDNSASRKDKSVKNNSSSQEKKVHLL